MTVRPEGRMLVAGATGTLGSAVVRRLDRLGADHLLLTRRPGPNRRVADLQTGAGLSAALNGIDVVINCASSAGHDEAIVHRLLTEAQTAGIGHIVHISIVGIDRVPLRYYREKLAVETLLAGSSMPSTILRATQFHTLLDFLFSKLAKAPIVLLPRGIPLQPVAVEDVAARMVELAAGTPLGRVDDFGGPDIGSATDFARLWLESTGLQRRIAELPAFGRLAAAVRAGGLLTAEHAAGTTTFADHLADNGDESG